MEENKDLQEIIRLENISRALDPVEAIRIDTWEKGFKYANNFLNTLPQLPGFGKSEFQQLSSMHIEENAKPIESLIEVLSNEIDIAGINSASGKHLGFIPGGGLWASALADFLGDITNKYAGIAFSSPGSVKIENQVIRWLTSIIGYSAQAFGHLTSGGSIANLIAIKAARDYHGINSINVRTSVIYYGQQSHHSVYKALHTTGLYEAVQRMIPLTDNYRIDIVKLEQQMTEDKAAGLKPFLVVASAGTTDTGAVDPLDAIADISERFGTWFHVDAAYGGFFMLVDEIKKRLKGIERSDSVVLDPHKTLFMPFGSGAVLLKDGNKLLASNSSKASYLMNTEGVEEVSPADTGLELTRPNRGLRMWLPLQLHGLAPFKACLQEKLLLIRYFYEEIKKQGFETGPFPDLTVVIFRYPDDYDNQVNQRLIEAIHADGRVFLSSTRIGGKLWLRCAVVSHRTHLEEINLTLKMIQENIDKIVS
jgi:glutamate/tyrosine decarboxylase-like PLP-dependent enzyme